MRLYKKAAAVLLAAAMAVSMMTACGGGAGGGNGGNGGNGGDTEIVVPVPGPDTTDPDQGGETGGTTTQPEKTKIPDVTKSQQLFQFPREVLSLPHHQQAQEN